MQPSVSHNPKKRTRHEIYNEEKEFQTDQFDYQQRLTRDQHRRIDEIAQQLAFLDRHETVVLNKVRKNARQLPEYPVIQHRRNLSLEEHRRVIWLRFGSLDSMDTPWHSSKEVFLRTGVRPSTQALAAPRQAHHNHGLNAGAQQDAKLCPPCVHCEPSHPHGDAPPQPDQAC